MGGLMALYTGYRLPEIFGRVLSQSGAFTVGKTDMVIYELIQHGDVKPLHIWMDVGKYDFGTLTRANPRLYDLLCKRGYPVTYREYPAGHNYPAWRDDVWRGLEHLYGC
jgi:enterochelin esterase family protein